MVLRAAVAAAASSLLAGTGAVLLPEWREVFRSFLAIAALPSSVALSRWQHRHLRPGSSPIGEHNVRDLDGPAGPVRTSADGAQQFRREHPSEYPGARREWTGQVDADQCALSQGQLRNSYQGCGQLAEVGVMADQQGPAGASMTGQKRLYRLDVQRPPQLLNHPYGHAEWRRHEAGGVECPQLWGAEDGVGLERCIGKEQAQPLRMESSLFGQRTHIVGAAPLHGIAGVGMPQQAQLDLPAAHSAAVARPSGLRNGAPVTARQIGPSVRRRLASSRSLECI